MKIKMFAYLMAVIETVAALCDGKLIKYNPENKLDYYIPVIGESKTLGCLQ